MRIWKQVDGWSIASLEIRNESMIGRLKADTAEGNDGCA